MYLFDGIGYAWLCVVTNHPALIVRRIEVCRNMRCINSEEVRRIVREHVQRGHHVDTRLQDTIGKPGNQFLLRLEDEESFLSLIWHEIDSARLLTPKGQPRTLGDVADRLLRDHYTFTSLTRSLGLPSHQHYPDWFKRCLQIDGEFDFRHFGWVAVVAANDAERQQSPLGTFYIYDGAHKALVLAKRLLKKETVYQPIEALYLVPRRH
jgi:(2Fe-2S) ferredoxin